MKAYQLKIVIKNSKPPIWRRCIIPADITFSQLGIILSKVMGWSGHYSCEFEFYHLKIKLRNEKVFWGFKPIGNFDLLDPSKILINEYMEQEDWFTYAYGTANDRQHRVTIEKIVLDAPYNYPQVIKYKGELPVEDGVEIKEHGLSYDIDEVNLSLKRHFFSTLVAGIKNDLLEAGIKRRYRLHEILSAYTKNDLIDIAKKHNLSRLSALRKEELVNLLKEHMLMPEIARDVFIILNDDEISEFERVIDCINDYFLEYDKEDLLHRLIDTGYIAWRTDSMVDVAEEVVELYHKISTKEFGFKRKCISWLSACFDMASRLYGVVPVEIMIKVFNQNKDLKTDRESLLVDYENIPRASRSFLLYDNLFVSKKFLEDNIYEKLMHMQGEKDYYIPTKDEILEISRNGVLMDPYMKKLIHFFIEKIGVEKDMAKDAAEIIKENLSEGWDLSDVLYFMSDNELGFNNEDDLHDFVPLISELSNNTRMLLNRGYKPSEMIRKERKHNSPMGSGNMPTIVPTSSSAAEILMENRAEIEKMGFPIDLDTGATEIPVYSMPLGINHAMDMKMKKIYPNDPCPCGSGKKYKRCCS